MLADLKAPSEQAKVRCFGSRAALTVEATSLVRKGELTGQTVNLDIAPRLNEQVDWPRKITIQLSENELPLLACVCLGYLPKIEFKRPGKGVYIERQANRLFVSATSGSGNVFALPLPIGQVFQVSSLILKQLQAHTGLLDGALVISALRGASQLFKLH